MVAANYLVQKAPQLIKPFSEALRKVPLFSHLNVRMLANIFKYSRFVPMKHGQLLFREGSFDQSVYLLLKGGVEVYVTGADGRRQRVDQIRKPFQMVGERSILGETQSTTVVASGETLMIGMDLSSMPDVQGAFENPKEAQADQVYEENLAIYSLLATVIAPRLERLIRDQYKLSQKLERLEETAKTWKTNEVMSLIFNQFAENSLPSDLALKEVITKVLVYFRVQSPGLTALLEQAQIDTQRLYAELVKLKALRKIGDLEKLIFTLVRQITSLALKHPTYQAKLESEPHPVKPIVSLAEVMTGFFIALESSGQLQKELEREHLVNSVMPESQFEPALLSEALMQGGYLTTNLGNAYAMFLCCRGMMEAEQKINLRISERIDAIRELSSSRQDVRFEEPNEALKAALNAFEQMAGMVL